MILTTSAGDESARARARSVWRQNTALTRLAASSVLAVIAVALLGCYATPVPEPSSNASEAENAVNGEGSFATPTFDDFSGFIEEYASGVEELEATLPRGWTLPTEPPGEWEPDGNYESGLGYMTAAFVVQCAWMLEYSQSAAAEDREGLTQSLGRLRAWIEIPGVQARVDDVYANDWIQRVIEPAEDGDATFLLDLAEGC